VLLEEGVDGCDANAHLAIGLSRAAANQAVASTMSGMIEKRTRAIRQFIQNNTATMLWSTKMSPKMETKPA